MTRDEKNRKIVDYYGADVQMGIAQEECAEMIQAISKIRRYGNTPENLEHLAEEVADTIISCYQMEVAFAISDAVSANIDRKLDRQLERMEKEIADG